MTSARAAIVMLAVLSAAPIARADEAHDLAIDIMRKTKADTLFSTMSVLIRDSVIRTVMNRNGKTHDEAAAIVDDIVMPSVRDLLPGLKTAVADLYVTDFSIQDLRGLDAFYDTALGQHMVAKMPLILAQTQPVVRTFVQNMMREILQKRAAQLRQKGVSL